MDDEIMGLEDMPAESSGKSTVVGIVLDRSGSMCTTWKEAIGAYHAQVDDLCKQVGAGSEEDEILLVSLVFDNITDVINKGVPVTEAVAIGDDVTPRGATALYDAIQNAIGLMEAVPIQHADKAYLLVVITDGEENASQEVNSEQLFDKIEQLNKSGVWTLVFIGSNADAIRDATVNLGVLQGNSYQYTATGSGTSAVGMGLRGATSCYMTNRTKGITTSTSFGADIAATVEDGEVVSGDSVTISGGKNA